MEDEISLSVSRVPARRFVYYSYHGFPQNWNEGLGKVNQMVDMIPTLTFAHNKIIFSMNGQKDSIKKNELECRVGREVVGYYEFVPERFENMGIIDGASRECYKFNLGEVPSSSLTFDKFLDMEMEFRKKTTEFGEVEDRWRIIIETITSSDLTAAKILAEIQFFSKIGD